MDFTNKKGQIVKNNEIAKAIKETANLVAPTDAIPYRLKKKIRMTLDINPWHMINQNVYKSGTATGTLYTVPSGETEFYLTSIGIGAGSTLTINPDTITFQPDGDAGTESYSVNNYTGTLNDTTATAMSTTFAGRGIRLKKGTNITTTKSSLKCTFFICGYTVDRAIYNTTGLDNE
jgi:hypothetical protein